MAEKSVSCLLSSLQYLPHTSFRATHPYSCGVASIIKPWLLYIFSDPNCSCCSTNTFWSFLHQWLYMVYKPRLEPEPGLGLCISMSLTLMHHHYPNLTLYLHAWLWTRLWKRWATPQDFETLLHKLTNTNLIKCFTSHYLAESTNILHSSISGTYTSTTWVLDIVRHKGKLWQQTEQQWCAYYIAKELDLK